MEKCPTREQLLLWRAGRLSQPEVALIEAHVSHCGDVCQPLLKSLASPGDRKGLATPAGRDDATASFAGKPASPQPDQPLPGVPTHAQSFGKFEILALLGKGAFGAVYRARDTQLGRVIAIKIPRKGLLQSREERERFLREAKAAATLHHPNICPIHESGESDGRQFIVMALIEGEPLANMIDRGRPLGERLAVATVRKLALALDEAHHKGIIHRDIKPANIMIDRRGQPVLMDFGMARLYDANEAALTVAGALVGTPAYMAPEQALSRHEEICPATDVYALGVVLYEMLTQQRPFEGSSRDAVLAQIVDAEPRPPSALRSGLDPRLDAICLQALAKDRAARFRSMREFAEALREYLKATDPAQSGGISALDAPEFAQLVSGLSTQLTTIAKRQRVPWWRWALIPVAMIAAILVGWLLVPRGPLVVTNVGVDPRLLADATLSFFLDDREITAKQAQEPMELPPGDHELVVKRQDTLVKHYRFHVAPRSSAEAAETPVAQVELREIKELAVVKVPPPTVHWDFDTAGASARGLPGVRGQAAVFAGPGDVMAVADDPKLHAKSALTLAAWVDPHSARAGHIAGRWSAKGSYLLDWKDGVYSFRVAFPVGSATGTPVAIQALGATSEWSHVVGVYDGARLRLYVDGERAASQELARSELLRRTADYARRGEIPKTLQDGNAPFEFGGGGFQGLIDEADVWDTALSGEQVAMLFESYPPRPSAPASGDIAKTADADRRIAEWVISRGGSVEIPDKDGILLTIKAVIDLPSKPFRLHEVWLFDDISPTDADLRRLDQVPDLKGLNITNFERGNDGLLTVKGIVDFVRAHPFLTFLGLDAWNGGLSFTDATLEAACECRGLEYLYVTTYDYGITDAGVAHVEGLAEHLFALYLPHAAKMTDASLSTIARLPRLRRLSIGPAPISESAILDLPQLLNLDTLHLYDIKVSDALLARLAKNRALSDLRLARSLVTDAGLAHLAKDGTLNVLELNGTAVSDAGVPHLKRLMGLLHLGVTETKLTRAGVDELHAALPRCRIDSDFGTFEPNAP